MALVEDEILDDNVEGLVDGQEIEKEKKVTYVDQGLSIVVQHNLKLACEKSEEDWLQTNVFHTWCTTKGRTYLVIIDSGSFKNVVSEEMVQKFALKTIPHPSSYKLCWL